MHVLIINFSLQGLPHEEYLKIADELAPAFASVPGLKSKTWLADQENNVLKNSPHTAAFVSSSEWSCPYSREQAAYPASWTREYKYWVPVRRIDNVQGDRNLICACPPLESYTE